MLLFLRYKLEIMEGSKNNLGARIICETSVKEPGEAPPHRLGNGLYLFKRGDISYQYSCKPKTVELRETEICYRDAPIHFVGKFKFMDLSNRMLKPHSSPEPCTPNFSRLIKGISQWICVGPKLKIVPPPRSKPRAMLSLKHHGNELVFLHRTGRTRI